MTMSVSNVVLHRSVGCVMALLLGACDDRATVAPPRPQAAPTPSHAWLVVSDSNARAGTDVTVSAYATMPGGGAIGSFTARFLYDSLQLKAVQAVELNDGALRAANPITGEYRIAGASPSGMPSGLLFKVQMQVLDPRGLRRIALALDEMHSTRLADLTEAATIQDGRVALLGTRPGVLLEKAKKQ